MTHEERAESLIENMCGLNLLDLQMFMDDRRRLCKMLVDQFKSVLNERVFDIWKVSYSAKDGSLRRRYFSNKAMADDFLLANEGNCLKLEATYYQDELYVLDLVREKFSDDQQQKLVRTRALAKLTAVEIEALGLQETV